MSDKKQRIIAVLEILTAVGIFLFWIGFYTIGMAPANPPACYFAYENSFPLPDSLLAMSLMASGILLLYKNPLGVKISLVSAGALIFLGLLDSSFNVQNGVYASSTADLVSNAFINIWCIFLGAWIVLEFKR